MKTKSVRNIPVVLGNETLCTFAGTLSWAADMDKAHIHAGTFAFACEEAAHGLDTSKLRIDEDSRGGVFCLYLDA